jgi:hypothetical protein
MRGHRLFAATAAVLLYTAAPATAQVGTDRVVISVNAAYQGASNTFDDHLEFEEFTETGTTDARYPIGTGLMFDGGAAVRLWKGFGVGFAFSSFSRDDIAQTDTRVPHPFFDDRDRTIVADVDGIARAETGVHIQARYAFGTDRVQAAVSGGPSVLTLEQEVVTEVQFDQTYPYDTATFRAADTRRLRASAATFNVGFDMMWRLGQNFGVGGMVRFASAPVDLDAGEGRTLTVDAGGIAGGAGVRIVF